MQETFDIRRFRESKTVSSQYEAQLNRLKFNGQEVDCIEVAVRGAVRNISENNCRSFVIYGEPQSGKTEMMICLTGKLLDEGFDFVVHIGVTHNSLSFLNNCTSTGIVVLSFINWHWKRYEKNLALQFG